MTIRTYWLLTQKSKRRKCIFHESCSNYVYQTTLKNGIKKGLEAFWFRYRNCRPGFQLFKNPITNEYQMILPNNQIIAQEEIAKKLIEH